jgi:bla regulator protein blaR1
VPFSMLVDLGVGLGTRLGAFTGTSQTSAAVQSGFSLVIDSMSRPFTSAKSVPVAATLSGAHAHPALLPLLAGMLTAVWLCGVIAVLAMWCVRWRRIADVVRCAEPLEEGRELATLRRLARAGGIRQPMEAVVSSTSLEPGIFGIFRSVLVWPQGLSERLDDEHIQAILAHEICHVWRRDNLAAAAHMLVEAIFWFHPLVWWMGKRLVEERERACDEQALALGNEPKVYAESILKTCEFCVGSPLACMAGVTGADLKERIVRIMANRGTRMLDLRRKLLLGAAGLLAVVVPLGFGWTHASSLADTTPDASTAKLPAAKFEVASIRPAAPQNVGVMIRVMNMPGRLYATNVTLKMLVRLAYGVQDAQIEGGPKWLDSDHFDIQAKADPTVVAELKKLPPDEAKLVQEHMLQELLAERFHLKVEQPVYALVVAKNGPKMKQSKSGDPNRGQGAEGPVKAGPEKGGSGAMMSMLKGGEMSLRVTQTNMGNLAGMLSREVNRPVLNKTGLKSNYDFTLTWAQEIGEDPIMGGPTMPPGGPGAGPGPAPAPDTSGPSIFTALQDQLGLKLKSEKGPVQALEIVNATQPTAN